MQIDVTAVRDDLIKIGTAGNDILGANVENAILTNAVSYDLTGNALDNALTGNAFANVLSGGGQASINQTSGIASFAASSGTTLTDALNDVASRFTTAGDSLGEFAFFRIKEKGDYYLFISDGVAGVDANDVVVQLTGVSSIGAIDLSGGNLTVTL